MSQHARGLLGNQLKGRLLFQFSSLCLGTHKMEITLLGEEQEDKMRRKETMFKIDKRRYFSPHYTQLTWGTHCSRILRSMVKICVLKD